MQTYLSETRSKDSLDTHQKALNVNLDSRRYGTFAEIGAGQEVVRWFFRVGGGAGTIAKSISAYDMKVSDAIYGRAARYVCRERLQAMLNYEHQLNLDRLRDVRGDTSTFFTFADTVAARGYKGISECHGWMGIKFQAPAWIPAVRRESTSLRDSVRRASAQTKETAPTAARCESPDPATLSFQSQTEPVRYADPRRDRSPFETALVSVRSTAT